MFIVFDFGILLLFFELCIVVWKHGYRVWYFVNISFDIRTARVRCQGELSPPPPGTRPPPGESYFLEYCIITCALSGVT
jgi:hypothetical protein